ncbi:MAG: hypothetical protein MRY49_00485 [Candidatus Pacebacteria bacterium]|nr:hypothetical protein [Candidatus Paceibacterota bacterium]
MKGIDKDNLHQTYIISGNREGILKELSSFIEGDVYKLEVSSLSVEDVRDIKSIESRKSLGQQFIIISAKEVTLSAQQALLKVTEDTGKDTHIFFVVPNQDMIIPTLKSRAFCLDYKKDGVHDFSERFWKGTLKERFILAEEIESDKEDINNFLDSLEKDCPKEFLSDLYDVKKKIRTTGVSVKILLEHLSLVLPLEK